MNNIEILEKLKDKQFSKETLITLCKFYDEEFKPYVLTTEERDVIENLIQENKELKEKNKEQLKILYKYEDTLERYENKIFNKLNEYINLDEYKKLDKISIKGKKYISKDKIGKDLRKLLELLEEGEITCQK